MTKLFHALIRFTMMSYNIVMNRVVSVCLLALASTGAACSSPSSDDGAGGNAGTSSIAGAASGGAAPSTAGAGGAASGGAAATGGDIASNGGASVNASGASGNGGGVGGTTGSSLGGAGSAAGGTSGSAAGGNTAVAGANAGGSSGHGGSVGTAGSGAGGSAAGGAPACSIIKSTATRPQLSSTQAASDTVLEYLAQSDNWNPTAGLGSASAFTANYTVAADGTGTHKTVQAAINAAASGTARHYILVKPGTYREVVSYKGTTPLTIYGAGTDAKSVVIVNNQSAASAGGTPYSATFTSTSPGLQLMNLTVSNDFATPATGDNIQAVALYVTGDKTVLENVRMHGFQDTFFADTASDTKASRVYVHNSFIEGDTDFIFGGATLVIDSSTVNYLSSRKGTGGGVHLAPSTRVANNFGILVIGSRFTADATAPANKISLGRSWDEGGVTPTPNGQAVIRESVLGAHIRKVDPWAAAASSGRAFSATSNRLFEHCNSGSGAGG